MAVVAAASPLLEAESDDDDILEEEGMAPSLEIAAWKGKLGDVRHFLRIGAEPNAMVTEEEDETLHHTPLMAAAAADSMDVVVELLLAGADPELPSPVGVIAADLAGNRGIMKILALFSNEVEAEAKQVAAGAPDLDAQEVRRKALAAVKARGLSILRRVLKPASILKFSQLAPPPPLVQSQASPEVDEVAPVGLSAREARKQRQEAAEKERLRKVAEKAAARRSQDDEESRHESEKQRLQRLAEKVAARRELDPEEARLQKIAQRAALRRQVSLRSQKSSEELSSCTALALLPEDAASQIRPRVERKRTAEVAQCTHCGQSGELKECGLCAEKGMCGVCSMCAHCGRVSGFCARPEVHARPGQYGLSGMPQLSGLSAEELQYYDPSAATKSPTKGKKKKKRRKGSDNSDSTSSGLELVEAPKGSPKDGESSEEEQGTYALYFVDNREYKAPSAGMAFRYSKILTDVVKDMRKFAAWGTVVAGWDQGDGWLKVGEFFLPMRLDGKRVLTFKASAAEAKVAPRMKKRPAPQPEQGPPEDA